MPQALITVNASVGSNIALPINTVVQLNNQNSGGEISYTWALLDQPPGAVDALSSVSLQNPTFTPKKEGTYLVRLIVNQGLPTEQENRVVCAVQQLKTLQRIPAAGETTEADSSDGWATAANAMLRSIDTLLSDPGIIVGVNASGGPRVKGEIVRATASSVIKTGLPGQETVPGFSLATAATLGQVDELLAVVEGAPDGNTSVANGGLMRVRYIGRFSSVAGSPAVGDTVYVSDTGVMALTQGTVRRRVGSVMSVSGGQYEVWFNGVGGADIDLTPIDRAYLVHGSPGTLPNAIRTDGTSNTASITGFRFGSGATGTVALTAKGFAGQTANIFEVLNSANTLLSAFDADGDLFFNAAARRVQWPDWYFVQASASEMKLISVAEVGDYFTYYRDAATVSIGPVNQAGTSLTLTARDDGFVELWGSNHPLRVRLNNVAEWQFDPGGLFKSLNKDRIANIDRPGAVADAVSTEYLFEVVSIKNPVINSGFEFWQRGTSFTQAHSSGVNVWNRKYTSDRWYAASVSATSADGGVVSVSRQTLANGLTNTDFACRLGYAAVGPGTVVAKVALVQEIDRQVVKQLRGKVMNVSAWLRNVSFNLGPQYTLKIVTGTGSDAEKYTDGYTGVATPGTTGPFEIATNLGTTFARVSAKSTAIGSTVTCMAVVLEIDAIGDGGGLTDGTMEVAEVLLNESASVVLPAWQRAAESYAGELDLCEWYFQKSYPLNTAPGTAVAAGAGDLFRTYFLNVSTANGARLVLGSQPRFNRRIRSGNAPAVRLYNVAGTIDSWTFGGGVLAVLADTSVAETGFAVTNNSGVAYNPGALTEVSGHWTVENEI